MKHRIALLISTFYSIIAASYFLYLLILHDSPNMHFHRAAYGLELFTDRAYFDDERSLRFEHRFAAALNRTQEFMNYFATLMRDMTHRTKNTSLECIRQYWNGTC